jgi:6-phosphogluconolactonase
MTLNDHLSATLPHPVDDVPAAFTKAVLAAFAVHPLPRFTLVLSGGPTAKACYEHLAAATAGEADAAGTLGDTFDWSVVDIFMGDERVVPPDDPDANQRLVRETIVDRVGQVGSFTPMPTTGPVEECVAEYQRVIGELLAGPGIDLIHLGLGADGHTASLFPNAPTLNAGPGELVAATEDPNGRNPHPRLTLTLPAINAARLALFTVTGESKRDAVAAVRRGDDIPALRVRAKRVVWIVDEASGGPAPA